jgi:von Willebrand factor type A domain
MTFAAFAAAVMLAAQQAPALPDEVVISAVVLDKKGHPVLDLRPDEFVVTEGGSERPITRAEIDSRPLNVALLLDSSLSMGNTYNADVIPAAVSFLSKLPQGATFSIWSTSDAPKVIVEQGTDVSAVETKLRNVAPFGHNAALDSLVAASQELAKDEAHRTALVLVTSAAMAGVAADVQSLLPKASLKPTYVAIQYIQGPEDARLQDALRVLVSRTAGIHERVFSTMAIQAQLMKALDYLSSSYRIAWKPGSDPRQVKIEVKVKRPGATLTQAQRISTTW